MFLAPLPRSAPGSHTAKQDSTTNYPDHAELGLFCADISRALGRGTNGKKPDEISQSVHGAMDGFSA